MTLASALEREHREIDQALESYLASPDDHAGRVESLTQTMTALRRHIYLEEEFLFPPLRDAGFVAPVFVMLREHGELWDTMASIDRELAEDPAEVPGRCKWLLAQLAKHNAKEEPILYSQADAVLDDVAADQLRTFLESGQMPQGWVCERARS